MSEDDPKADPSGGEAEVHWVAHVAVGTDDHQMLRRSDRSGCAAAGPAEVPDAAQGDCETQHGGNSGQPAPARGSGQNHKAYPPPTTSETSIVVQRPAGVAGRML